MTYGAESEIDRYNRHMDEILEVKARLLEENIGDYDPNDPEQEAENDAIYEVFSKYYPDIYGAESLEDLDKSQLIDLIKNLEDRDEYVKGYVENAAEEWHNDDEGWDENIRFDNYKSSLSGKIESQRQHLDKEKFKQAISDGYTFYDYGDWGRGQPYRFEKNGDVIEIPVVKMQNPKMITPQVVSAKRENIVKILVAFVFNVEYELKRLTHHLLMRDFGLMRIKKKELMRQKEKTLGMKIRGVIIAVNGLY